MFSRANKNIYWEEQHYFKHSGVPGPNFENSWFRVMLAFVCLKESYLKLVCKRFDNVDLKSLLYFQVTYWVTCCRVLVQPNCWISQSPFLMWRVSISVPWPWSAWPISSVGFLCLPASPHPSLLPSSTLRALAVTSGPERWHQLMAAVRTVCWVRNAAGLGSWPCPASMNSCPRTVCLWNLRSTYCVCSSRLSTSCRKSPRITMPTRSRAG